MHKSLLAVAAVVAALATAGIAAAAPGNGADVVDTTDCYTTPFGKYCTTLKTVTNATTTPSGNVSYVTNGTMEYTIEFVFGGSYSRVSALHSHSLSKAGEVHESSDHYEEQTDYVSGTYHLSCVQSYDLHWANGSPQIIRTELECTPV